MTMAGPHNDPTKPRRNVVFQDSVAVAVLREWFAAVKPAEVETSVALPGRSMMLVVELVISLSKAGHECSRSIDASRAALRRPRFASGSSISGRMPRLFLLDFQWMSTRTCQQRLRGWHRRAAPREQAAPQAGWMDEEAWQAWYAASCGGETLGAEARFGRFGRINLQIAWCRHGMAAQAKAASKATWSAKQRWFPWRACKRRATRRRHGLRCES